MESSRRGSKKDTGKYVAVRVGSAGSVFLLDPGVLYQSPVMISTR